MSAPVSSAVLMVSDLHKSYGGAPAVKGISFSMAAGELVALIGPNGAGKTTLLDIIAGLSDVDGGSCLIAGAPAGSLAGRQAVAYVPAEPIFFSDLTVTEHLEFVAGMHRVPLSEYEGPRVLDLLGLSDHRNRLPSELSRGYKQRAMLGTGLIRERTARLLLVDEPFVGLDVSARVVAAEAIARVAKAGLAVLVATHQPEFLRLTPRCIALREAHLIYDGPTADVAPQDLMG